VKLGRCVSQCQGRSFRIDGPARNISVRKLDIANKVFKLAFELDPPTEGNDRREKRVRCFADGENHGPPESVDILVPEQVEIALAIAEDAKADLQLLDAERGKAAAFHE